MVYACTVGLQCFFSCYIAKHHLYSATFQTIDGKNIKNSINGIYNIEWLKLNDTNMFLLKHRHPGAGGIDS